MTNILDIGQQYFRGLTIFLRFVFIVVKALNQMPSPGGRYAWFQSDGNICINYFRKNMALTDVRVEIERRKVSLYLTIPTGDELLKKFQLLHEVVPEESSYRVTATKIEIKLKKADKVCWSHLESQDCITGPGIRKLKLVRVQL
ncbi:unnamed protein product [Schistosoma spindalis]|nr:unnamed protein product [Schistosoma spindale]